MRSRLILRFEPLETRNLLSGGSAYARPLASDAEVAGVVAQETPGVVTSADFASDGSDEAPSPSIPSHSVNDEGRAESSPSSSTQPTSSTWDWLAQTSWYVPAENLLAYKAPLDLSDPTAIGDQTIWYFAQSSGGQVEGEAVVKLSDFPESTTYPFSGVITAEGQVRLEFDTNSHTTGVGQLHFVDGAWRIEMQMGTGSSEVVSHWAFMSQLADGATPPDPADADLSGSVLANEWSWLAGTDWAIVDSNLFDAGADVATFDIVSFDNGYFWGPGTSSQPFNVLGSVTPEGNVLLMISVEGEEPQVRTGHIDVLPTSASMRLRSYEGDPAIGLAWTPAVPSKRGFLSSTGEFA